MRSEFDLIEHIRARVAPRPDVVLGIGDDGAVLEVPDGHQLVVTADTLNAGVHFPHDTPVDAIGWKSLAVNLSDLAAMGAQPAWCTLSLSMPESDPAWLDGFLDGFLSLAARHRICLIGGDTTRGPLSIAVTALGLVPHGSALRRDGAREHDDVWVTGTLGDAAAALADILDRRQAPVALRERLDRPGPRVDAGLQLQGLAHACIDLSDGLLADLGHICTRSGVGAEVELAKLPASAALAALDQDSRWLHQASGGDDYELCFTAAQACRTQIVQAMEAANTAVTRIGAIVRGQGVHARDAEGKTWRPSHRGYQHFS